LEGLPLGIELAACWTRLLTCEAIADEIGRSLDFLAATARDLPARHRSMRAVFDHSWALLDDTERQVLARLSVFRGGFGREAAEAVLQHIGETPYAALAKLASLVDKSLLRPLMARNGEVRYDMHELLRQYAESKLAAMPEVYATAHDRHGGYFTSWVEGLAPQLKGPRQKAAAAEILTEIDNLRYAWHWAVTERRLGELHRMMRVMGWFYEVRGLLREGADAFCGAAGALERLDAPVDGVARAAAQGEALAWQGWFALRQGELAQADALVRRGIQLLRSCDAQAALGAALLVLGAVDMARGAHPAACAAFEESRTIYQARGDGWGIALSLVGLGRVAALRGDRALALQLGGESLRRWSELGDPHGTIYVLNLLSALTTSSGDLAEAQTLLRRSLAISSANGDRWGIATALNQLGRLAQRQGEHTEAEYLLHESLVLFAECGDRWSHQAALG
jgi:tetratricopeptide (TPR) repeat protein